MLWLDRVEFLHSNNDSSEKGLDGGDQILDRVRFGQELSETRFRMVYPFPVIDLSTGDDRLDVWIDRARLAQGFFPAHSAGDKEIKDHQDFGGTLALEVSEVRQGVLSMCRFSHVVSVPLERFGQQGSYADFIFHDNDGLRTSHHQALSVLMAKS